MDLVVKSTTDRSVADASVLLTVDKERKSETKTDGQGKTVLRFESSPTSILHLEVSREGYRDYSKFIRLPGDDGLVVALTPTPRVVTIIAEDASGRLDGAGFVLTESGTTKVIQKGALNDGIGSLRVIADPDDELSLRVSSEGHVPVERIVTGEGTYLFKLKPEKIVSSFKIMVKDSSGSGLPGASVVLSAGDQLLARKTTGRDGTTEATVSLPVGEGLTLSLERAGYAARKLPLKLPVDDPIEVALTPLSQRINVLVEDVEGNRVTGCEVRILDKKSATVLKDWFALDKGYGPVDFEPGSAQDLEVIARASGHTDGKAAIAKAETSVLVKIAALSRRITVLVESEEGNRLKGAEARFFDAKSSEPLTDWESLKEGYGPVEVRVGRTQGLEVLARAPGHVESRVKIDSTDRSAVAKLKPLEIRTQLSVVVKSHSGKALQNVPVRLTVDRTQKLAVKTDAKGKAVLDFSCRKAAELNLDAEYKGYEPYRGRVDLPLDKPVEVSLAPAPRSITLVAEDPDGGRLRNAEVSVTEVGTGKLLESTRLDNGTGTLVLRTDPDQALRLTARAPGRETVEKSVGEGAAYRFALPRLAVKGSLKVKVSDARGNAVPGASLVVTGAGRELSKVTTGEDGSALLSLAYLDGDKLTLGIERAGFASKELSLELPAKQALEVGLAPLATKVDVIVEGSQGTRLENSEARVIDAKASAALTEWTLLRQGFGSLTYKPGAAEDLQVLARAPGHLEANAKLTRDQRTALIKLKPKVIQAKARIKVTEQSGKALPAARVRLLKRDGTELDTGITDDKGGVELEFQYSDLFDAYLHVTRGGYRVKTVPIRLMAQQSIDAVLSPEVPLVKSTFLVVLVLDRRLKTPANLLAEVKQGVVRLLGECRENSQFWDSTGAYALGNREIRDILPITRDLNQHLIEQAESRLRDLSAYSGALSWRDLESLAKFLEKSGKIGPGGCDILLISPKNIVLSETDSLQDLGGEDVLDLFRQRKLRLRLVEVGQLEQKTKAYQELCDGTFGAYKVLSTKGKLSESLVELQYHFPKPPQ